MSVVGIGLRVKRLPELGVSAHAIAVAAYVDDVAVMQEPLDEDRRHDLVPQDLSPLLEALAGCQHGGVDLVAPVHELEDERGPGAVDGQIPSLVHDQQRRESQDLEPMRESAGGVSHSSAGARLT